MSQSKPPKSLDDMLQADRKKRKAEELAQTIFGKNSKNRRQSAPVTDKKAQSPGASFASRVGVNKRSSSSSSQNRQKQSGRPHPPSQLSRAATAARLETTIAQNGTPTGPKKRSKGANGKVITALNGEISIRGAAGPYTVIAQNFAPGTTAADIASVISSIGGPLENCKLVTSNPTVVAEMVFADKQKADLVISSFNGKKADGRVLYVHAKEPELESEKPLPAEHNPWRDEPEPVVASQPAVVVDDEVMDVDRDTVEAAVYREDRVRRDEYARGGRDDRGRGYSEHYSRDDRRDDRRPDLMHQDGRYGFGDQPPAGPRYDNRRDDSWRGSRGGGGGRMYSDDMMRRSGPPRRW
ncbi:putative nucleic acid binding protein 8 [Elsinoe australis]|uniref:Putative nucleic acid binding protein 8 n=1 Tax=Elsinoe australis TaxID=40998 RepID=A0A4U7BEA5_9PEZI|nr:putative nucleic acid binding protein 8 [Elsinoe australis]